MILEFKNKKRFPKKVISIIRVKNTFSVLTKSNVQYIEPDKSFKLPINPDKHIHSFNNFYYLNKNKIYRRSDKFENINEDLKEIKTLDKIYDFKVDKETIIACSKKIMIIENDKVMMQLYGPDSNINSIDICENMILVCSSFDKKIRLFNRNNSNHTVYDCPEIPNVCLIINEYTFLICTEKGKIFIYNTDNCEPIQRIILCDESIDRISKNLELNLFFVSSESGNIWCYSIDGFKEFNSLKIDGTINCILSFENRLIVGLDTKSFENSENPRNYIFEYEIKSN